MTTAEALESMQAFLNAEGIKHFSAAEVFYLGDSNAELKLNSIPPRTLWHSIIPTLRVLDEARAKLGPLQLKSVYRNLQYNKAIGGASASRHMQFDACDVKPLKATVDELYKTLLALRKAGKFKGGVGKYPTFVHVDTRGKNVDF